MKKLILFSLLLAFLPSAFAQTTSKSKSKSDKPRNWRTIWKLYQDNYDDIIYSDANIIKQWGFENNKFTKVFSLKSFAEKELNSIERELLSKYTDVAVTPFRGMYFTIENNNCIGVAAINGEELLTPTNGGIIFIGQVCLVGEQTNVFREKTLLENATYGVAYPVGMFKNAIYISLKNEASVIMPKDEFLYCSTTTAKGKPWFYVCKLNSYGQPEWGVYSDKGKEVVECKYKGVIFENGKFKGTDDMDMLAVADVYDKVVDVKRDRRERRDATLAMIGSIGSSVGTFMIGIGTAMQQSQSGSSSAGVSASDSSSKASGGVDYLAQYRRWERIAERHYNSITNLGTSVKYDDGSKSGSAGQSMSPANYTSMKKSYREAQQEMARIRREAAQAGVSIPQSPWETNTISY